MNKTISWLCILLIAQIALAASLYWGSQGDNFEALGEPLLTTDTSAIDKLVVANVDTSVTLEKKSDAWYMMDYHGLPVNSSTLETLLSKLGELEAGWPVASSSGAQERFEVAPDKFQKHVQLFSAGTLLAELYVGSSPAYKRSHVRRAGEDDIFSVELNAHDLYVKGDDWLDKTLLMMADFSQLKGVDFTLQKHNDTWRLSPEPADDAKALNVDQVKQLTDTLSGLRVQAATDKVVGEAVNLSIGTAEGALDYALYQQGDAYWVKRSDQSVFLGITKSNFETLAQANRAWLTEPTPELGESDPVPGGMTPDAISNGLPQGMSLDDLPPEALEALQRQMQEQR